MLTLPSIALSHGKLGSFQQTVPAIQPPLKKTKNKTNQDNLMFLPFLTHSWSSNYGFVPPKLISSAQNWAQIASGAHCSFREAIFLKSCSGKRWILEREGERRVHSIIRVMWSCHRLLTPFLNTGSKYDQRKASSCHLKCLHDQRGGQAYGHTPTVGSPILRAGVRSTLTKTGSGHCSLETTIYINHKKTKPNFSFLQ